MYSRWDVEEDSEGIFSERHFDDFREILLLEIEGFVLFDEVRDVDFALCFFIFVDITCGLSSDVKEDVGNLHAGEVDRFVLTKLINQAMDVWSDLLECTEGSRKDPDKVLFMLGGHRGKLHSISSSMNIHIDCLR